jgi:DNA-binding HxlR family transcriptional regulator
LIVRDLAAGPRRFVELQRVLPGISTEQLRSRLNRMVADGMLTRKRYREVPPRVDYELTRRARELMPVLAELARWGYEWAWSSPRGAESIDLGAIFRLAPGLIRDAGATGTVEFKVTGDGQANDAAPCYSVTLSDAEATVNESESAGADAHVTGDVNAWITAFCPTRDRSGLTVSGDTTLATLVLDGLMANDHAAASASRAVA